jgi:hypothetical protein
MVLVIKILDLGSLDYSRVWASLSTQVRLTERQTNKFVFSNFSTEKHSLQRILSISSTRNITNVNEINRKSKICEKNSLPIAANGPAVCLVGVSRRRGAQLFFDCPVRNASKANPRRVWRGFCHHDRSCEG